MLDDVLLFEHRNAELLRLVGIHDAENAVRRVDRVDVRVIVVRGHGAVLRIELTGGVLMRKIGRHSETVSFDGIWREQVCRSSSCLWWY